jgi:hypothetical protein
MEHGQSLHLRFPLIIGAVAAAAVSGYLIGSSKYVRPAPCYAGPLNDPIVNKALDLYGNGVMSREEVRTSVDVNVVHLRDMTCVGFNLLPGTAGGSDTMCLDHSGKRVLSYRTGI